LKFEESTNPRCCLPIRMTSAMKWRILWVSWKEIEENEEIWIVKKNIFLLVMKRSIYFSFKLWNFIPHLKSLTTMSFDTLSKVKFNDKGCEKKITFSRKSIFNLWKKLIRRIHVRKLLVCDEPFCSGSRNCLPQQLLLLQMLLPKSDIYMNNAKNKYPSETHGQQHETDRKETVGWP
jgi:hypothetical protein